jgi:hypothetical protein
MLLAYDEFHTYLPTLFEWSDITCNILRLPFVFHHIRKD